MSVKVTHIVRQYLPSIGGMEEVVRNIALHQLRTWGQSVRIITLDRLFRNTRERLPARDQMDGIEILRLPYFGSSRYPVCPSVLRELGDTDVIHVHGVDFFYDFLAATKWLHRRPLVLSTHGGFFHTRFASRAKQAYFKTVTRLSSTAYNHVIATSANDGQMFSQIMGKPKLQVIENGVDVEKFADQAARRLQPVMIYFGRWSSNKGLREAIDFFATVKHQDARWRLIIAGREYDHSLADLQNMVTAKGLGKSVILAPNPSDDDIRKLLQQASYFVCLSHHEGFGIAPIEAMSAGLTPILSDIPPFQRLLHKSNLGFSIPSSLDYAEASRKLLDIHQQGNAAYEARRAAAMSFSTHYAWPQVANHYLALYEQLGRKRA